MSGSRRDRPQEVSRRPRPGTPPPSRTLRWACLSDVEHEAARRIPAEVRDFVAGGSGDEATLRANRTAFDRAHLVPRVLAGVADPATGTTLLGRASSMPLAVAPMAYQRLLHRSGELAVARAARDAGVPLAASMLSSVPIERLTGTGVTAWFQLYWLRDRDRLRDVITRAEVAGCAALVITADTPVTGRRIRDMHNGYVAPANLATANMADPADRDEDAACRMVAEHTGTLFRSSMTWDELAWLRAATRLPLVLKGVLHAEDASRAIDAGVDAIVVSNHGGRQLDRAVPSLLALPAVVRAVEGRCQVLLDGGVRGGTDVLVAMSRGADAVLLGRPVLWGLAAAGRAGVDRVLALVHAELCSAMALAGCPDTSAAAGLDTIDLPDDWLPRTRAVAGVGAMTSSG